MRAPRDQPLGRIDNATAKRLLESYLPIVRAVAVNFYQLDQAELRAAGEDAILEAFLTFDSSKGCLEATWVRRVVHWRLAEAAARSGWESFSQVESLGTDPQVLNGADPEQQFLRATAVRALGQLTIRQQNIMDGRMRGETYEEIAEQLGVSDTHVYRAGLIALQKLRSILEDGDGTPSEDEPD